MTKRILCLMLTLVMLSGMAVSAFAENDIQYKWVDTYQQLVTKSASKMAGEVSVLTEYEGKAVRLIGENSYSKQKELTGLVFPDHVWGLGRLVGAYNDALESVVLPEGLISMDASCFSYNPALKEVTIPASVSFIDSVFNDCTALEKVVFEGVCPVVDTLVVSFRNLPETAVIYVPDDQLEAYKAAFAFDESVAEKIQPSGKNAVVVDHTAKEADFDFDPATGTILAYKGEAGRVDIPSEIGGVPVRVIGENAFFEKYTVCFVTIPEGVETIGKYAFGKTEGLEYAVFPSTLRTIEAYAFINSDLQGLALQEGVEEIGKSAFATAF